MASESEAGCRLSPWSPKKSSVCCRDMDEQLWTYFDMVWNTSMNCSVCFVYLKKKKNPNLSTNPAPTSSLVIRRAAGFRISPGQQSSPNILKQMPNYYWRLARLRELQKHCLERSGRSMDGTFSTERVAGDQISKSSRCQQTNKGGEHILLT